MELERFKAAWHGQEVEADFGLGEDVMIGQVRQRGRKFHRRIFWRDLSETAAAILVAFIFGFGALKGGALMQIGAAVVIAAAAAIVIVLHTSRRRCKGTDTSLKRGLEGELRAVDRQIKLLRNVHYWYIAPLFAGGLLFGIGTIGMIPPLDGMPRGWILGAGVSAQVLVLLVVGLAIWWINQLVVRRQLKPLRDRIAQCLDSLAKA